METDRRKRFKNVRVSRGFWFCCNDLFNCLVCIEWCRGRSVTIT